MKSITKSDESQKIKDVLVGENVQIFSFVNLYGCKIGDNSKIGTFVEIQRGVTIGANCKISSHSFICEGVEIKENCFIGHGVMFINDRIPRATNINGQLQSATDWECIKTTVSKGASIGTNATILCGITIGENAVIGAGAVVTKDVLPNTIVVGNPAKIVRILKEN
jgi:UDP-2-acetamido-3-amino-2,3-dideoxy-glucuronate N-acetyltransferase